MWKSIQFEGTMKCKACKLELKRMVVIEDKRFNHYNIAWQCPVCNNLIYSKTTPIKEQNRGKKE